MQPNKYDEKLQNQLLVKSKIWSYEKEVRFVRIDQDPILSHDQSIIKSIILGHCATKETKRRLSQICRDNDIICRQARVIFDEYDHIEIIG